MRIDVFVHGHAGSRRAAARLCVRVAERDARCVAYAVAKPRDDPRAVVSLQADDAQPRRAVLRFADRVARHEALGRHVFDAEELRAVGKPSRIRDVARRLRALEGSGLGDRTREAVHFVAARGERGEVLSRWLRDGVAAVLRGVERHERGAAVFSRVAQICSSDVVGQAAGLAARV
jgi:hypothetical protein